MAELDELNSSTTVMIRVQGMAAALRLMMPGFDPPWLRSLEAYLERTAKPSRDKRSRVVPAKDLLDLGLALMARARSDEPFDGESKDVLFRDGLLIALLISRPLRLKNLTMIRMDEHLIWKGDLYWLVFQTEETKTKEPIQVYVPEALGPLLHHYMIEVRPRLIQNEKHPVDKNNELWVGRGGTRLTAQSIRKRIEKRTQQAFGHPINPHLFRDCVSTSIAIEDPAHVRISAPLLGHSALATAEKHYNQATSLEASRAIQKTVLELRKANSRPCRDTFAPELPAT